MPKSGNEDHRQELREELKEKLDYIASYSSLRTYSMSRGSRSDDYAERCTKIIKTAPNALSLNILTDFLKTKNSGRSSVSKLTEILIQTHLDQSNQDNVAQYRTLMPSLIEGNQQDSIFKSFKDHPELAEELHKWVLCAIPHRESSIASALCCYNPDAIEFSLHVESYNGQLTAHKEYLEQKTQELYPNAEDLQGAIANQKDNAYKALLQEIQYRDNIDEGWNFSRENDAEISFSTNLNHVKLTRIFNFKSKQVTQVTEASEKMTTDIQNFSDIEHGDEVNQARHYLNLYHGQKAELPSEKRKLSIPIKTPSA